jgi:hypothetical protein
MTENGKRLNIVEVRLDAEPVIIRIPLEPRTISVAENVEITSRIDIDAGI